jgi:hypothetical protein
LREKLGVPITSALIKEEVEKEYRELENVSLSTISRTLK